MSAQIPESIPTSADPRSKRPTKKRALTPSSGQASQLEALFANPEQEIALPSTDTKINFPAAPEIVSNVQGSSAGAGSGEFHVYKASRRREYERLRAMDEEVRKEEDAVVWERERKEREEKDAEKTRKNREKRERLKMKKGKKGGAAVGGEEVKVGKMAPRILARTDNDGEDQTGVNIAESEQPQGLIIHDDD